MKILLMSLMILLSTIILVKGGEKKAEAKTTRQKMGRFVAFFTSTSVTRLATTTLTALSTCVSFSAGAPNCNGRRKRSLINDNANIFNELQNTEIEDGLDGSVFQKPAVPPKIPLKDGSKTGRKLSIWTTRFTTLTLTSTSYIQGTTVSVSILCALAAGANSCFG